MTADTDLDASDEIAMAVGGLMSKQAASPSTPGASSGGLGGLVAGLTGGGNRAGSGGLGSLLDMDGNGNPLDDIMRLAGKTLR